METFENAVFISYAWGDEREQIVNAIDKSLQARGMKIVRDKRDLEYKGSIKEFMERIGRGDCIIVVVSDKYLKSPNCMFELVEIADNKLFENRIFPVVLADADIYRPIKQLQYIKFWEDQIRELKEFLKTVDPTNLQGIYEQLNLYDRIRDNISRLTNILSDMNSLMPDMHRESDFDSLYTAIEKRMGFGDKQRNASAGAVRTNQHKERQIQSGDVERITFPLSSHVFLCYSSSDYKQANRLRSQLQDAGISVWQDKESISAGAQFSIEIEQAIRRSSLILALTSKSSGESPWVRNEILFAIDAKKTIIPVIIEEGATPILPIYGLQNIELAVDWEQGVLRLIDRIQSIVQEAHPAPVEFFVEPEVRRMQHSSADPFVYGSAIPVDLFIERKQALNEISARVGNLYSFQSISIVANRRIGKTSLLRYIWKKPEMVFAPEHRYATIFLDAMDPRAHSIEGFMRVFRRALQTQLGRSPWSEINDGTLTYFTEALDEIVEQDEMRVVLLIDELESIMAFKELDILLDALRSCGSMEKIGMVTSTAHELSELEYEGNLTSRFSTIFKTHFLANFSRTEWELLVRKAFERVGTEATPQEIELIGELSGGHPYLVQLAGSLLWKARHENTTRSEIKAQFRLIAKDIFSGIIQRMKPAQVKAIKIISGLMPPALIAESTFVDLRNRGVLTSDNEIFCKPFSEYIYDVMRTE